jgi:hypothetical protein
MISAANIRQAFDDLLHGLTGTTRTIDTGFLAKGHDDAWGAQSTIRMRYDLSFGPSAKSKATPISAIANIRFDEVPVTIKLYLHLPANIREDARDTVRATLAYNADLVGQAIGFPGNLALTYASAATGIVSGMVKDITYGEPVEDWKGLIITMDINGVITVKISQAT